jgi:molybdenum cofactor synthesis domain-containing protein
VEGIDFRSLPVGTRLYAGDVQLEMTQIGKECHSHCAIYKRMGECIMPKEGVFARVIREGIIRPGDVMRVEPPAEERPFTAAVITLSDKGARGERKDESGPAAKEMLEAAGYEVVELLLLPDEPGQLKTQLIRLADSRQVDLVLTSGGTGFSLRDQTPEATMAVAAQILNTAALSYLGLGQQPPAPELGSMLSDAKEYMRYSVWGVLFPGLTIATIALSLNLVGDGLRDALDPRLKN